jgi:hydrogenase maturation protease
VTDERAPIVVIGIGNRLLGDDAVGPRMLDELAAAARIDASILPPHTRLIDGGTLGLDLMRTVENARAVLLLDAVDVGGDAGDVVVLEGDAITAAGARGPGGAAGGIGELLALARLVGWLSGPVALVGVQPGRVGFSRLLSAEVERSVPAAVALASRTLHEFDTERTRAGVRAAGIMQEASR